MALADSVLTKTLSLLKAILSECHYASTIKLGNSSNHSIINLGIELLNSLKYIAQMINMELVQVANCIGPKFVHVATSTSQPVQVATCTCCLCKLLVQNLNLSITYISQMNITILYGYVAQVLYFLLIAMSDILFLYMSNEGCFTFIIHNFVCFIT